MFHLDSAFEMHRFGCPSGLALRELVHTEQTLEKHRVNRVQGRFWWCGRCSFWEGLCRIVQKGMWDVVVVVVVIFMTQVLEGSSSKPAPFKTSFRRTTSRRSVEGVLWGPRWFGMATQSRSPNLAEPCGAAEVSVKSCTNTVASCSPRSLFEQRLGVASLIFFFFSDLPSAPGQVKMSINACFARMIWEIHLGDDWTLMPDKKKLPTGHNVITAQPHVTPTLPQLTNAYCQAACRGVAKPKGSKRWAAATVWNALHSESYRTLDWSVHPCIFLFTSPAATWQHSSVKKTVSMINPSP